MSHQAWLAAQYDGRPAHHPPACAQEVPDRQAPDQRERLLPAVRALLHHQKEDPRVGAAQGPVSAPPLHTSVNVTGCLCIHQFLPE